MPTAWTSGRNNYARCVGLCDSFEMKQVTVKGFLLLIALTLLHGAEARGGPLKSPSRIGAMDIIAPCRAPAGAAVITRRDSLPRALRDALKQKLGELVPPSSPFDATDVVQTGHNRRLIFIWSRGNRWVVATEHGGRGYNDPILAYDLSADGAKATLHAERITFPKAVCSTAEEFAKPVARSKHMDEKRA